MDETYQANELKAVQQLHNLVVINFVVIVLVCLPVCLQESARGNGAT